MDYSQFIDREGETSGSLTPVGFVMIDGQQIPARSHDRSYVNPVFQFELSQPINTALLFDLCPGDKT